MGSGSIPESNHGPRDPSITAVPRAQGYGERFLLFVFGYLFWFLSTGVFMPIAFVKNYIVHPLTNLFITRPLTFFLKSINAQKIIDWIPNVQANLTSTLSNLLNHLINRVPMDKLDKVVQYLQILYLKWAPLLDQAQPFIERLLTYLISWPTKNFFKYLVWSPFYYFGWKPFSLVWNNIFYPILHGLRQFYKKVTKVGIEFDGYTVAVIPGKVYEESIYGRRSEVKDGGDGGGAIMKEEDDVKKDNKNKKKNVKNKKNKKNEKNKKDKKDKKKQVLGEDKKEGKGKEKDTCGVHKVEAKGKVRMAPATGYRIYLQNENDRRCNCILWIDGREVGQYRLNANSGYYIENREAESLKFSFLDNSSPKAKSVIIAEFLPEKRMTTREYRARLRAAELKERQSNITNSAQKQQQQRGGRPAASMIFVDESQAVKVKLVLLPDRQ